MSIQGKKVSSNENDVNPVVAAYLGIGSGPGASQNSKQSKEQVTPDVEEEEKKVKQVKTEGNGESTI